MVREDYPEAKSDSGITEEDISSLQSSKYECGDTLSLTPNTIEFMSDKEVLERLCYLFRV